MNEIDLRGSSLLGVILEVSPDAVVVTARHGGVLIFNPAAEALLGYSSLLASSMNIQDMGADAESCRRLVEAEDGQFQLALCAVGGERIPVRVTRRMIGDDLGDRIGSLLLFRDMRTEIGAEGGTVELLKLEQQFSRLKRRINNVQRLSQPLSVATGITDILLETPNLPGPVQQRLEQLARQLGRLGEGLSDLSRVLKVDTGPGSDTRS